MAGVPPAAPSLARERIPCAQCPPPSNPKSPPPAELLPSAFPLDWDFEDWPEPSTAPVIPDPAFSGVFHATPLADSSDGAPPSPPSPSSSPPPSSPPASSVPTAAAETGGATSAPAASSPPPSSSSAPASSSSAPASPLASAIPAAPSTPPASSAPAASSSPPAPAAPPAVAGTDAASSAPAAETETEVTWRCSPSAALLGVTPGYYLAYAAPRRRAQPPAESYYVAEANDFGSGSARKRGFDDIEGQEPPVAPAPAAPTPVPTNYLARGCFVQVERWPGSWFWAKIVGVYAGNGPLRGRIHGGEDTARVVFPGVDDWELDVPLTGLRRGGGRDPAAPERSRRRVMCVGSLPVSSSA